MARFFLMLGLLVVGSSFARAQGMRFVLPVEHRQPDFSNIVGAYKIQISAEPVEVEVEEPITLRVQIIGEGLKEFEPNRKGLKVLPAWDDDFYVQPMPDKDEVLRDKKTWVFVYRLKPKHAKIDAIDDIKLAYYDPKISDEIKYVSRYANRIEIKVKPRSDALPGIELDVKAAPDSFYAIEDSKNVLVVSWTSFTPSGVPLVLLLVVPALACIGGAFAWRRFFPDEAQRARRQRGASARRALAQLRAEGNILAWDVVRQYLHDRFGFAVEDPAPMEVSAFLKRRGFAKARCAQGQAFFETCDAVRYTAEPATRSKPLTDEAARLVEALETDPCARG